MGLGHVRPGQGLKQTGDIGRYPPVMIAHLFLVSLQQDLQQDAPALTVSQARLLLQAVLPRPPFDRDAALQAVCPIQRSTGGRPV